MILRHRALLPAALLGCTALAPPLLAQGYEEPAAQGSTCEAPAAPHEAESGPLREEWIEATAAAIEPGDAAQSSSIATRRSPSSPRRRPARRRPSPPKGRPRPRAAPDRRPRSS